MNSTGVTRAYAVGRPLAAVALVGFAGLILLGVLGEPAERWVNSHPAFGGLAVLVFVGSMFAAWALSVYAVIKNKMLSDRSRILWIISLVVWNLLAGMVFMLVGYRRPKDTGSVLS
jgi:peptidoglycan/LPS O-acetylase OafA/YrhL